MSLNGLFGLSRDALLANAYALNVTGQNVANANTRGYARREVQLETAPSGTATFGGVRARGLERITDQFTDNRYYNAQGYQASTDTRQSSMQAIDELFSDVNGLGLSDSLGGLFNAFSELATNPNDLTLRTNVLARTDQLCERFRSTATQLTRQRDELLSQARDSVKQINTITTSLADLNQKIQAAQGTPGDGADLKDQRDRLIDDLSKLINVETFVDSSNRFVVRGGGVTLVEASGAVTTAVALDGAGNLKFTYQGTSVASDFTSLITSGKLQGLKIARDSDAAQVQTSLDQLAFDIGTAINTQHAAGFGLDGVTGRNLFNVVAIPGTAANLTVNAALVGQPSRIAAASTAASLPGGGDNAVAIFKISDTKVATGNTRTPSEAYGDLVGDVGQRGQAAKMDADVRTAMAEQSTNLRDSSRGVSTDEEMITLTKYQRSYEAASKLLRTVDELLGDLIRIRG